MTLLSICQAAAQKALVTVPSTIIGNTDLTAKLLLECAQEEGELLARKPQGGWTQMISEHVFTTFAINTGLTGSCVAGSAIVTPSSMANLAVGQVLTMEGLPNNAVIATVGVSTVTLASPYVASSTENNQQLTVSQQFYTLPSDFERMIDNTLWDRTRFWAMRGAQSPQEWQVYKSSAIGRASIQRRWRIISVNNVDYFAIDPVPTDNGSYLVFEYVSNAWCQSATGTKQTQWMADTDTGILDEFLMRMGVIWRVLDRLGMNYLTAKDDYERAVNKATAADGGAATLNMAPIEHLTLIGPWNLPETGFGNVVN